MQKRMVLLLAAVAIVLAGCARYPDPKEPTALVVIETSPNWDYIPIDKYGVSEHQTLIGNLILQWEKDHSDRRIVDIDFIYKLGDYQAAYMAGVSIYSEKR